MNINQFAECDLLSVSKSPTPPPKPRPMLRPSWFSEFFSLLRVGPLELVTQILCPPPAFFKFMGPMSTRPRPLRCLPGPPPSTLMMSSFSKLRLAATSGMGR